MAKRGSAKGPTKKYPPGLYVKFGDVADYQILEKVQIASAYIGDQFGALIDKIDLAEKLGHSATVEIVRVDEKNPKSPPIGILAFAHVAQTAKRVDVTIPTGSPEPTK